MVNFFINPSKNVLLLSLANVRNEAIQQPVIKSLNYSIFHPISLDTCVEIVGLVMNVKNRIV
jgi:hypothetical protein